MLNRVFLWESGPGAPAENMAWDEVLLETIDVLGSPLLRLYGWSEPAATFGYSQKYAEVEQMTPLRPLLRRPTGGGLVPHDADWTYSLVFPRAHPWHHLRASQSYQILHRWIQGAFRQLGCSAELARHAAKSMPGQCFAGPDQFDLLWQNRKIAGAAQRRKRSGLLIQGSVQPPPGLSRHHWTQALLQTARDTWKTEFCPWTPPEHLQKLSGKLAAAKYSQPEYNEKR
jgi:lipoate-protein ligase A